MATEDIIRANREKAIALIPKFSAFLSVIGSAFIIYDIVLSHFNIPLTWWQKKKPNNSFSSEKFNRTGGSAANNSRGRSSRRFAQRKTLKNSAYYRLMLAMSSSDFMVSFAWFCTTWPIPKDDNSLDSPSELVYGNIGTMKTCEAQAFFIQLGIITPFYNALLASYYYLTIRREWKEEEFKRKIEYAGHFLSVSWGLGTSIAGLSMKLFNNSIVWCWINTYPIGCGNGPEQTPCIRGINAGIYRWIFYYGPLWLMIFLVAFFMSLVYLYVRSLDNKMDQYTRSYRQNAARTSTESGSSEFHSGGDRRRSLMARTFSTMNTETLNEQRRQRRNERSKAVANQGLFYAGTFALVWVFATIVRGMQLAGRSPPWIITFWFAVFTPSQGFFNFLVYIRPRLLKFLEQRKKRREGRRNSRTGSSFNSDILHVSGISCASSSHEVSGEMINRDNSTRSDLDLSDPFMKSKPDGDTPPKVRFAASETHVGVEAPQEITTKVRFESSKVRFISDDNSENEEKGEDVEPVKPKVEIKTVGVTLNKAQKNGLRDVELSNDYELKKSDSEETIDPALLSSSITTDDEDEKVALPLSKKVANKRVELHNATIDLATGEVRTRPVPRSVSP